MATAVVEKHLLYKDHPEYDPIEILYYPNSHAYKINGERKIGTTSITSIIAKEALAHWFKAEAIKYLKRKFDPKNNGEFAIPESIDQLNEWCKEAGVASNKKGDFGKDTGTATHAWLEAFLRHKRDGEPMPEPWKLKTVPDKPTDLVDMYNWEDEKQAIEEWNNIAKALDAFVEWWDEHDIEVVAIEEIIYSKAYDFSGRFDCILRIDGKLYLVDFKTNNPTWEYPKGIYPEVFAQLGAYDVAYTEEHHYDLHLKNQSPFDGHLVINLSKKNGKVSKEYSFDTRINRSWFGHVLGTKRGMQHHIRNMSNMYKENRNYTKKAKK